MSVPIHSAINIAQRLILVEHIKLIISSAKLRSTVVRGILTYRISVPRPAS